MYRETALEKALLVDRLGLLAQVHQRGRDEPLSTPGTADDVERQDAIRTGGGKFFSPSGSFELLACQRERSLPRRSEPRFGLPLFLGGVLLTQDPGVAV